MTEPRPLRDYAVACGQELLGAEGDLTGRVAALVSDSRQAVAGALFVAIHGARTDGHRYLREAVERGATALVVEGEAATPTGVPVLRVRSGYTALGRLAELHFGYPGHKMTVVGVTGTNGKTTTCWLLRHILRRAGYRTGLLGTVAVAVGEKSHPATRTTPTPIELQSLLQDMQANNVKLLIAEVSSHALDQGRLGTLPCAVAVFTNLTRDHLDYHPSMEAYFIAKQRLFSDHLAADGTAVINVDDPWGKRLAASLSGRQRCLTYGLEPGATVTAASTAIRRTGTELALGGSLAGQLHSPLVGRHNVSNLLAAHAAATALGVNPELSANAIADFRAVPGRLERIDGLPGVAVFVDYAHTPDALASVLAALRPLTPGRLKVLFGCGGDRDRGKRPEMGRLAVAGADEVVVTSDNPRTEEPERIIADILAGMPRNYTGVVEPDRRSAIGIILAGAAPGDTVLLAGKGHEDYQEVRGVQHAFDDRVVAREAIARLT